MVREIVTNEKKLREKSEKCSFPCASLKADLEDTLLFYKDRAIGIAANMIGENKRAMAIIIGGKVRVMFNPVILSASDPYFAEEGCLSLKGRRKVLRHLYIELLFSDENGQEKIESFSRLEAEASQHEMDHMEGVII